VHGIKRRSSLFNTDRIDHLYQDPHEENVRFHLYYGDLSDSTNIIRIVQQVQPDEIYNLGAMSHVQVSFDTPEYTANADGIGTLRILEAIRIRREFIRRPPQNCMAWCRRYHNLKLHHSIHAPRMLLLRYMLTGLL